MKIVSSLKNSSLALLVILLSSALPLYAQDAATTTTESPATAAAPPTAAESSPAAAAAPAAASGEFGKDQLEQLVAPIALYQDSLLTQILMASTYPLEVVEADRFMKQQNPKPTGAALDKALLEQDWDPSVKSLCALPDVLSKMSENLDWTQDLGDAFLGQQAELMDTVQRLRGLAYDEGNLKTSEQQVVTQQPDKIIVIESPDPEVVYVPTYSSTVVYGSSWGYPSYYYPPMYTYPPGYGLVSFGIGMAIGGAIWGDCNWGWGSSDIDIDINRYNEFNRNTNINADRDRLQNTGRGEGKANWNHDASHRKGVNYRNPEVAQRNGAAAGNNRVSKDQARGRSSQGASNRASPTAGNRASAGTSNRANAGTGDRASASNRQAYDPSAAGSSQRSSAADRSASSRSTQSGRSNSAYSGSRSPSADRMSSSRGASSRGMSSYGGSRGGGAMRSGGGRRR